MCVCVSVCPVSNSFLITPRIGTKFVLSTGKHPVVGQLPRVSLSALPGQSSDRPNLPPNPSAITALFLDRSLVVVHLTGHDQMMTVEILRTMHMATAAPTACRMPADLLAVATWCSKQPRAVCRKCFMFHLDRARRSSPVVRSIGSVSTACANDVTWPGVACVCKSMKLAWACTGFGHLKQRPRKCFFAKKLTFFHRWRSY